MRPVLHFGPVLAHSDRRRGCATLECAPRPRPPAPFVRTQLAPPPPRALSSAARQKARENGAQLPVHPLPYRAASMHPVRPHVPLTLLPRERAALQPAGRGCGGARAEACFCGSHREEEEGAGPHGCPQTALHGGKGAPVVTVAAHPGSQPWSGAIGRPREPAAAEWRGTLRPTEGEANTWAARDLTAARVAQCGNRGFVSDDPGERELAGKALPSRRGVRRRHILRRTWDEMLTPAPGGSLNRGACGGPGYRQGRWPAARFDGRGHGGSPAGDLGVQLCFANESVKQATEQKCVKELQRRCAEGAQQGCALSGARACRPTFLQRLFDSGPSLAEQEQCEKDWVGECCEEAKQSCEVSHVALACEGSTALSGCRILRRPSPPAGVCRNHVQARLQRLRTASRACPPPRGVHDRLVLPLSLSPH
eukprot:scaffold3334_cov369-Prasinococcus_capsulatus_cf.AAC.3